MTDADRYRLLFGPYATPVFQYGDGGFCELRGEVILCGLCVSARIVTLRSSMPTQRRLR